VTTIRAGAAPLRVHVLVDLLRGPAAGGHVKVWERLSAAACAEETIDLTVHFEGSREETQVLGENVRFEMHRPRWSTTRLPFLSHVPDHTDLAPHHRLLAARLARAELLHTTDGYFAYARTAERVAQRRCVPLVNSIHTATPAYAGLYTAATIERLLGRGIGRALVETADVRGRAARWMQARLTQHQRRCTHALVSRPEDRAPLARALSPQRVSLLRRGIDRAEFSPARRDRRWLVATFGMPLDCLVVLFVGRLDIGKNLPTLVEAVHALLAEGAPLHLICAGRGPEAPRIAARLGRAATCPGVLDPQTLARVYASADLLAHPSLVEESSNVVLEALASGLPVLAHEEGAGRVLVDGQTGLVIYGPEPRGWIEALRALAGDHARRESLGRAGRAFTERHLPSWAQVLREDLMPVWFSAAQRPASIETERRESGLSHQA
jgi:glycosyltransferase involved in cell wall biosynthesis